jgi:hypothetical protein
MTDFMGRPVIAAANALWVEVNDETTLAKLKAERDNA